MTLHLMIYVMYGVDGMKFCREKLVDDELGHFSPIFAYLECLPSTVLGDQEDKIREHLCRGDGSFFRSPSATAHLFMATANAKSLEYLNSLVQNCPNGGERNLT